METSGQGLATSKAMARTVVLPSQLVANLSLLVTTSPCPENFAVVIPPVHAIFKFATEYTAQSLKFTRIGLRGSFSCDASVGHNQWQNREDEINVHAALFRQGSI